MTPEEFLDSITVQPEAPPPLHKRAWAKIKVFMVNLPKYIGLYLGLVGLFSFNCFILEEAFQTVMFGAWGAFEAREYRLIKREMATQETLRTTLRIINNTGGWLNPFGWFAYQGYVDAEREWIDATNAKLFAHAPEVFAGEIVTFTFLPQEEEPGDGCTYYRNGRITVVTNTPIKPVVTGLVRIYTDINNTKNIIVDTRKDQ